MGQWTFPYYAYYIYCHIQNLTTEISSLKATINSLNVSIGMLQSSARPASAPSQPITCENTTKDLPPEISVTNTFYPKQTQTTTIKEPPALLSILVDKKFNIVMFGIKESPPKTPKADRYTSCKV